MKNEDRKLHIQCHDLQGSTSLELLRRNCEFIGRHAILKKDIINLLIDDFSLKTNRIVICKSEYFCNPVNFYGKYVIKKA